MKKSITFFAEHFQILVGFCLIVSSANGQSLFVKEFSGTQTSYTLANIRKLTFSSNNMDVVQNSGTQSFPLTSIRNLNFAGIVTSVSHVSNSADEPIFLYPNPAKEQFSLMLNTANLSGFRDLVILDSQGKEVYKTTEMKTGSIDISFLSNGLYLCRISTIDNTKTIKFIKE